MGTGGLPLMDRIGKEPSDARHPLSGLQGQTSPVERPARGMRSGTPAKAERPLPFGQCHKALTTEHDMSMLPAHCLA
jgi:hypothetical protein